MNHFFHQTLLEYAIAYWLNRRSSTPQRDKLVVLLSQEENHSSDDIASATLRDRNYWWPVMRQLLTLADYPAFESIARQLGTDKLEAFRTVVFAAASRDEPEALKWAMPIALEQGSAHQKVLQRALELASAPLAATAWEMMRTLLIEGERKTASTIAQLLGAMLVGRQPAGVFLQQAIAAIESRVETTGNSQELTSLCGWLVDSCVPVLQENPDASALKVLRRSYHLFSEKTRSPVIALHLLAGVSFSARFDLLKQARQFALDKRSPAALKEQLARLLAGLLPEVMAAKAIDVWSSWLDAIHVPLQDGFGFVQAKAVGYCAANAANQNLDILKAIVTDFVAGPKQHTSHNLLALSAAIEAGAAAELVATLTTLEEIAPERIKSVGMLVKEAVPALDDKTKSAALEWSAAKAKPFPEQWLPILLPLGKDCPKGAETIAQLLSGISPERLDLKQQKSILVKLPQLAPVLGVEIGDILSEKEQVEIYQKQALTSDTALRKLASLSRSRSKKTATSASNALRQVHAVGSREQDILPLLDSRFPAVRLNGLEIIKCRGSQKLWLDVSQLEAVCVALSDETESQVLQRFCEIVASWIHCHRSVPIAVREAIAHIPQRLRDPVPPLIRGVRGDRDLLEAGIVGSLVDTLNVIASLESSDLGVFLGQTIRYLLSSFDFKQVQESKTVVLLGAIARTDGDFLPAIVNGEMCQFPVRNQHTVVLAIKRVEGPDSLLLKYIAAQGWCHPEVKNLILSIQGT